ncbi:MAG: DUF5117 domain-containing protein [bacterium]|nr:DUF5117 domain-containing protein [bacterium]
MHYRRVIRTTIAAAWAAATLIAGPASALAGRPDLAKGKPAGEDKPDFPKFDEVTKDMKVTEGLWTLYHDKKKDRLLARIPSKMLDEHFLMASSISAGQFFAGWQWSDAVVYFQRMDKKLVLIEVDPRYARGKGSELEDVIGRTYTDTIMKAVQIQTEAPGGDPVIDLADLFKSDLAGVGKLFGGRIDRGLSQFSKIKSFPNNVELGVKLAVMGKDPSAGGQMAGVYYSVAKIPKSDFKPREADDRIGYFLTVSKDWTVPHDARTVFKRYVNRWHLQKVDPEAEVSDVTPETQIVFYIEKTVPKKYRHYVREGILEWNKAFEKAGLRNAVAVRQQTDNTFADIDPEDARYSFIRWVVTGWAFAMGPSRANPFTGEIFDADIIFDDSMVRHYVHDYDVYGPRAWNYGIRDEALEEFTAAQPGWQTPTYHDALAPGFAAGPSDADRPDPVEVLRRRGQPVCQIGAGAVRDLALSAASAAQNGNRDLPEEFIGQVIKEIVMHEVGHTLGLRHNFKASTWLSLADIKAASAAQRATTGSVMDYNANVYAPTAVEQGQFITTTLGPYDYWAIEYGYRTPGKDDGGEKEMLEAITDRVAESGLAYGTDEDSSLLGADPWVNTYDNGNDPIAFARDRIEMVQRLRKDMADWAVRDGESYMRLRRAFDLLLRQQGFGPRMVARLIGGQNVNRDHKGDPNARSPFEVIPAETQRQALEFLGQTVFDDKAFTFDPALLNKLGPGRWWHWDSDEMDFIPEYPIHDRVRSIQSFVLFQLMNPFTINRLHDAQLKVPAGADSFDVPELFGSLTKMVWSELDDSATGPWTNRRPRISSLRRGLQREHLRRLIDMVLSRPGAGLNADAHALARMTLKELGQHISRVLTKEATRLDDYTAAHLSEAQARIERTLDADFVTRD